MVRGWRVHAIGFLLLVGTVASGGATLLPNGSFEEGPMPTGWRFEGGGTTSGVARSGARSIGGRSATRRILWRSDPIPLERMQSYRLDGWITVVSGAARLILDLSDPHGQNVATAHTTEVSGTEGAGQWQYVALEYDAPESAANATVALEVEGEAYLDDATLFRLVENLLFNPSFDGDQRRRVTYWDEDPLWTEEGAKGGAHQADPEGGRGGGSALLVEADLAWRAVRNISMPVPTGVTTLRLVGWAQREGGDVGLRIVWLDWAGTILGADRATSMETVDGWTRFVAESRAPDSAEAYNVTVVVRNGRARFDDFDLRAVAPAVNKRRVVRVHVNQVGYEPSLPKSLVVATSFLPARSGQDELTLLDPDGWSVGVYPLIPSGRINSGTSDDWGWYFWRVDFSDFAETGTYRAVARIGDVQGESPSFRIGRDVLFGSTANLGVEFFFVQRCGFDVPGWHRACHLDDAKLPDGTHIDATGGWHSAGDYNKLMYENGDGGVAYALLEAYQAAPECFAERDRDGDGVPDVLDEALWGADFVAKMQVPETGALRKDVSQGPGRTWMKWLPPDEHTDNVVGTDDDPVILEGEGSSPLVIAAWMRLAALVPERETGYRGRALRLWNHATGGGTKGHGPHLMLSALELYRHTGEQAYLDYARQCVEAMLGQQVREGRRQGAFGTYGEYAAGALAQFALAYPDDPLVGRIRVALGAYVTFCASTADNPFGLAKQSVGEPEYFFEPTSGYGHNFEILARAWAALLVYRLIGDDRAARYAVDQVDWVFGKNPYGLCMFEGAGAFNPPRYHHRYDSIPGRERGAVPGAIPNGFVRSAKGLDQPGFDLSRGRKERPHPSYRTSEPWLVHNMWHLLAMTEVARVSR